MSRFASHLEGRMHSMTKKALPFTAVCLLTAFSAFAQSDPNAVTPEQTPPPSPVYVEPAAPAGSNPPPQIIQVPLPPDDATTPAPVYEYDAGVGGEYRIDATLESPTPSPTTDTPVATPPPVEESGAVLDGHVREGAFLAGPGSLTFVLHHSIMGFVGGLATQGISTRFALDSVGNREQMLAGSLIGAGLGFGVSAWWQFNHWLDKPVAYFGIVNSMASGMFMAGLIDLVSDDALLLTWTAFLGAQLGAWLTTTLGGGEMPLNKGLLMTSGGGWGLIYGALFLAILKTSGTQVTTAGVTDTLLIAPGLGAGLMALATMRYNPTSNQILRADLFGAAVGGGVLLLSALVLGDFGTSIPYVLAMLSSAGAMATVSILYEEAAETPPAAMGPTMKRKYNTVWW